MRVLERGKTLLGALVRDDRGAGVLERLAAGDVIEVVVAVDQELDRLVRHLLDFGDVVLPGCRPAVADRIGRDHAILGDNEHRLMVAVAEDIDVVGPFDFRGLDLRSRRSLLRQRRCREPPRSTRPPFLRDAPATWSSSPFRLSGHGAGFTGVAHKSLAWPLTACHASCRHPHAHRCAWRNASTTRCSAMENRSSTTRPLRTMPLRPARSISTS